MVTTTHQEASASGSKTRPAHDQSDIPPVPSPVNIQQGQKSPPVGILKKPCGQDNDDGGSEQPPGPDPQSSKRARIQEPSEHLKKPKGKPDMLRNLTGVGGHTPGLRKPSPPYRGPGPRSETSPPGGIPTRTKPGGQEYRPLLPPLDNTSSNQEQPGSNNPGRSDTSPPGGISTRIRPGGEDYKGFIRPDNTALSQERPGASSTPGRSESPPPGGISTRTRPGGQEYRPLLPPLDNTASSQARPGTNTTPGEIEYVSFPPPPPDAGSDQKAPHISTTGPVAPEEEQGINVSPIVDEPYSSPPAPNGEQPSDSSNNFDPESHGPNSGIVHKKP
ncbi:hypothetical protein F4778DRAFT_797161 [Xylariomycetidae sp. FL2044]|nr:hypothetical protein F4778DRAFT_797161 [Xylariomycetidae sp. FL2044]